MRFGFLGVVLLAAALPTQVIAEPGRPSPLHTFADVRQALRGCWRWPPLDEARPGMELTVRIALNRNGEIMSIRTTYLPKDVSDKERTLYQRALLAALGRCTPLPLSQSDCGAAPDIPYPRHQTATKGIIHG